VQQQGGCSGWSPAPAFMSHLQRVRRARAGRLHAAYPAPRARTPAGRPRPRPGSARTARRPARCSGRALSHARATAASARCPAGARGPVRDAQVGTHTLRHQARHATHETRWACKRMRRLALQRRAGAPHRPARACAHARQGAAACAPARRPAARRGRRARGTQGRTQVVAAAAVEEHRPPAARALDALRGVLAHGDRACRAPAPAASSALPARAAVQARRAQKRDARGRRARLCRPPARSPGGPQRSTPAPRARHCTRARPAGAAAGRWVGLGSGPHGRRRARLISSSVRLGRPHGCWETRVRVYDLRTRRHGGVRACAGARGACSQAGAAARRLQGAGQGLPAQQRPGGVGRAADDRPAAHRGREPALHGVVHRPAVHLSVDAGHAQADALHLFSARAGRREGACRAALALAAARTGQSAEEAHRPGRLTQHGGPQRGQSLVQPDAVPAAQFDVPMSTDAHQLISARAAGGRRWSQPGPAASICRVQQCCCRSRRCRGRQCTKHAHAHQFEQPVALRATSSSVSTSRTATAVFVPPPSTPIIRRFWGAAASAAGEAAETSLGRPFSCTTAASASLASFAGRSMGASASVLIAACSRPCAWQGQIINLCTLADLGLSETWPLCACQSTLPPLERDHRRSACRELCGCVAVHQRTSWGIWVFVLWGEGVLGCCVCNVRHAAPGSLSASTPGCLERLCADSALRTHRCLQTLHDECKLRLGASPC